MHVKMKPVHNLLNSGKVLTRLGRQLAAQAELLELVRSQLPQPLDEHCVSAILHQQNLTLLTDSPVWASRLRYLSRNLQQRLRQTGVKILSIKVKICIIERSFMSPKKPREATLLSPDNAELLRSAGECMQDKGLRDALLRLSRHTVEN